MPELELCSSCGREVLISRYPWSTKKVLCQICIELDCKNATSESESDYLNQSRDDGLNSLLTYKMRGTEGSKKENIGNHKEDILITWPVILKISSSFICIVVLISIGLISQRNGIKMLSPQLNQSHEKL